MVVLDQLLPLSLIKSISWVSAFKLLLVCFFISEILLYRSHSMGSSQCFRLWLLEYLLLWPLYLFNRLILPFSLNISSKLIIYFIQCSIDLIAKVFSVLVIHHIIVRFLNQLTQEIFREALPCNFLLSLEPSISYNTIYIFKGYSLIRSIRVQECKQWSMVNDLQVRIAHLLVYFFCIGLELPDWFDGLL